ncbi:glycine betaine ABC transporter substrate-binding protein [Streptomyces harbinensis]|uniref:glycine betaine ABC transporter substrate-binding protein n=1 Tax=Streptomyces harbinensis TaxID=1176198 RepID=UPI0034DF02EC
MRNCRRALISAIAVLGLTLSSGCALLDERVAGAGEQPGERIAIAVPDWPGGQANAAVAGYVLENELGIGVDLVPADQARAWDGLNDGTVQALLEDWGGLPEKTELYVRQKRSVVDAGELGVTGHIGWFVPKRFSDAHPDVLDWENLNDFAEDFNGELLQADAAYATFDAAIIEELGLELTPVAAGSESALLESITEASRTGAPLLTYWWQPHWLNAEVEMAEIRLPQHTLGCQSDPATVACAYPDLSPRKYLNAAFAQADTPAADFLRAFEWSTDDQNEVARLIEAEGLSPGAAAERWVTENPDQVERWLPGRDD